MPTKTRASNASASFAELLNLFPCHAWIETASGQILAQNTHASNIPNRHRLKTTTYPLQPAGKSDPPLHLIAHFPAKQKHDYHHHIISALLTKLFHQLQPTITNETCLTPRQREIYRELVHGHCYKTIAARIGISHEAVRQRIVQIRRKLGVSHIPVLRRPSLKIT